MYPLLNDAKAHYEKLIRMHDQENQWHIRDETDGSLIVEFTPKENVKGFVAKIVHIAHPNKAGQGYFILFLWDSHYSGALGVTEMDSASSFEPSYFSKQLMAYAEHLSHYKDSDKKDPFRYLLTDFGGLFCNDLTEPKNRLSCKHVN